MNEWTNDQIQYAINGTIKTKHFRHLGPEWRRDISTKITRELTTLSIDRLKLVMATAKEHYLNGKNGEESEWLCKAKNILTVGMSYFFRHKKADSRLPNMNDFTEANLKEKLLDFLQGPGESHLYSLKYLVVNQLIGQEAINDGEASSVVKLAIDALKQRSSIMEATISHSTKKI